MPERIYDTAVEISRDEGAKWVTEDYFEEAAIRELGNGLTHGYFGLWIPRDIDPDTGTELDADGDRSMKVEFLFGGKAYIMEGVVLVTGFKRTEPYGDNYRLVRWEQSVREPDATT